MQNVKEARHHNGLTVGVPAGFAAKQTDEGFIVETEGEQNRQVRHPVAI